MPTNILTAIVAFAIVMITCPILLPVLHRLKFGQTEREDGPASHLKKQGTPTMGGITFIAAIIIASLAFGLPGASMLLPAILCAFGFGMLGFLDDFIKIKLSRNLGLRAYQKIIFQVALSLIFAIWAYLSPNIGSSRYLPFTAKTIDLGIWYIPFVMFVIIAEVNSVNLTDGLDGLSSSVTLIFVIAMSMIFSLLSRQANALGFSAYATNLNSMTVFCFAVVGSLAGFLWFNSYPARIFMGDTGSMALGGIVAILGICSKSIIFLPFMGICYVASAVSVILQVGSYKLRHGKRIFKMAPLHHHFELLGYHESKIVTMYSIVTALFCAICVLGFYCR